MPSVRYLVFDLESVTDGNLVEKLRYPSEQLGPAGAIAKYRAELMDKFDSDFVPYTYQLPVAIAVAKVAALLYLVPPVAAVMAFWLFGEALSPVQIVGMALAAVGVAIASRG